MEEALIQIGLPVRCHQCGESGYVKPGTDWGGWARWKSLRGTCIWYCPDHADAAQRLSNPVLGSTASEPKQDTELDELMDLI